MRVGQINEPKSGGRVYIKIDKTITLNEGDVLFLSKPAEEVDYLVEQGKLTLEAGEERKAKIPKFVKYNINTKGNSNSAEKF